MALLLEVDELLHRMNLNISDLSEREKATYQLWLEGVDRGVKDWCKWELVRTTGRVEYYDGNGTANLPLRTPWVVDNSSLAVRLDQTGYGGQATNRFAAAPAQTKGTDYMLRLEGGSGKSGLLVRLPGASITSYLWPSDSLFQRGRGGLAWRQGPYWPAGIGNIKVTCDFGFASGSIPEGVRLAVAGAVALVRNFAQKGWPVSSETLGDYSYSAAVGEMREFADVRSYLKYYRDTQF